MQAITVCVDYSEYLSQTLPLNRGMFDKYLIVTTPNDMSTLQLAVKYECSTFVTTSFYADNADFNKWLALEEGLDFLGRGGWLCLLDADIVLPTLPSVKTYPFEVDNIYSPLRHLAPQMSMSTHWGSFPIHNPNSFAGYCQIFHAEDKHLPRPPWHQTDWKHAGGADSFFGDLWPQERKLRPHFNVLHLGPVQQNWCGVGNQARLQKYLRARTRMDKKDLLRYANEKIQLSTSTNNSNQ